MTRVSENSNTASVAYSLNKSRQRLEDLQLKGSTLKRIVKPSDDPVANIKTIQYKTDTKDLDQYRKNINFSTTILDFTENALTEASEILLKSKEIAIQQSSEIYNPEVRNSVAEEIKQMKNQLTGIANRRLGNRYIFGGHKTLARPYDQEGAYSGDLGIIYLEVFNDFYLPVNVPGVEVFTLKKKSGLENVESFKGVKQTKGEDMLMDHNHLKEDKNILDDRKTMFDLLNSLEMGLRSNNVDLIQTILEDLDDAIDQIITIRTQIGSSLNTVESTAKMIDDKKIFNVKNRSELEDADVAELMSEIQRQNVALEAAYKTSSQILDKRLLNFLR